MGIAIIVIIAVVVVAVLAAAAFGGPLRERARHERLRRRFGPEYEHVAAHSADQREADRRLTEIEQEHAGLDLRPLPEAEAERYRQTWADIEVHFVEDPRDATSQAETTLSGLLTDLGYPAADQDRQLTLAAIDHPHSVAAYRDARRLVHTAPNGSVGSVVGGANGSYDSALDGDGRTAATEAAGDGVGAEAEGTDLGVGRADVDRANAVADGTDAGTDAAGTSVGSASTDALGVNGAPMTDDTEQLRQAMLRYRTLFDELVGSGSRQPATAARGISSADGKVDGS